MPLIRILDRIFVRGLAAVCIVLFVVMIVAVLGQVIMRYVFSSPLSWSEELARYTMVWMAMLATGLCARLSQHLALMGADLLPPRIGRPLVIAGAVVTCLVLAVLFHYGLDLASRAMRQRTPGLGLPMGWLYAAMPTGFALMILGQALALIVPPRETAPATSPDPHPAAQHQPS